MQALAFAPYPETGPSTRFRLRQFVEPLRRRGVDLEIRPFLSRDEYGSVYGRRRLAGSAAALLRGLSRRARDVSAARTADVVLVQRELAPILNGPTLLALRAAGTPLVYDFDDAVFLSQPGASRVLGLMRRPRPTTAAFVRAASVILAGNEYLADFARAARRDGTDLAAFGGRGAVRILPTVIDSDRFRPSGKEEERRGTREGGGAPVVGWIGSHTTSRYLSKLFPLLVELQRKHQFRVLVVSNRKPEIPSELDAEYRRWSAEEEVRLVRELDVGLYPLDDDPWTRGKCGFKAIQYLACGVPVVASPVGVIPQIVLDGRTGYLAGIDAEWVDALGRLIEDVELRGEMGRAGREHVVRRYSVSAVVDALERALRDAAEGTPHEGVAS